MKGFEVLDLDTPLLLEHDPVAGGYRYRGPRLLPWHEPGLGMSLHPPDGMMTLTR
jgi:L-alanine-DL-glutamate epimerase-like enolase superfamily enzyme